MSLKGMLKDRRLGWLAIFGPAYALISIWISISLSPWFGWRTNAISDLGVHDVAPIFNASLIICGLMCVIFAFGMLLRLKHSVTKAGMMMLFSASVSLVGIGIFTEDYSPTHYQFSVAFFVLLLIAALILAPMFLLRRKTRPLGFAGLAVLVLGIFGWAYHYAVGWGTGIAIPEAMTFVPGALWIMMFGFWAVKRPKSAESC